MKRISHDEHLYILKNATKKICDCCGRAFDPEEEGIVWHDDGSCLCEDCMAE